MIRKPHTLQCRAVTFTETKLTLNEQASFFNVLLDYFLFKFLKYLVHCGQEANLT
jgi:hypothetical protein